MKRVMVLLFGGAILSGVAAYAAMAKSEPRAETKGAESSESKR